MDLLTDSATYVMLEHSAEINARNIIRFDSESSPSGVVIGHRLQVLLWPSSLPSARQVPVQGLSGPGNSQDAPEAFNNKNMSFLRY